MLISHQMDRPPFENVGRHGSFNRYGDGKELQCLLLQLAKWFNG